MKSQVDRKFDSRSQLLHSKFVTACLSDKKEKQAGIKVVLLPSIFIPLKATYFLIYGS